MTGVLVGNKKDYRDGSVDSRAEVVKEDAQRLAEELGLAYFETSAVNIIFMNYIMINYIILNIIYI